MAAELFNEKLEACKKFCRLVGVGLDGKKLEQLSFNLGVPRSCDVAGLLLGAECVKKVVLEGVFGR